MPRISTKNLNIAALSMSAAHQIYNGLDAAITHEVRDKLQESLLEAGPLPNLIYSFERGMMAPALEMMQRGFRVDQYERHLSIERLEKKFTRLQGILNQYANAVWGQPLNSNSPKQLKEFFYEAMKLPPVEINFKGVRRVSTNREALEKLCLYFHAVPIVNAILAIRDVGKKLSVLRTQISQDGRFRTSYNVAATETGRWNSSADAFGEGSNLQNITMELRKVFIADDGWKLGHLDLEQAESRVVGLIIYVITGDEKYLLACESDDLHTTVAKLLWPGLVHDRASAELPFYRHFTYRDMAKRGGHASNYRVTPWTMTRSLKIGMDLARTFQETYFTEFPGLRKWHLWVGQQLGLNQLLTTPLGRRRHFFGRPDDDATLREAIAYVPQSVGSADLLNVILYRLWQASQKGLPLQLLTQEHDGLTFQYPDDKGTEQEVLKEVQLLSKVELSYNDTKRSRTITIPTDLSVGWNWATAEKPPFFSEGRSTNPGGLKKWRGKDDRIRPQGLDRLVS